MKVSGNTISPAPSPAASSIKEIAFFTVASRSRNTGVAWTAAAFTFCMVSSPSCLPHPLVRLLSHRMMLEERGERGAAGMLLPPSSFQQVRLPGAHDRPLSAVSNHRGALVDGEYPGVRGDGRQDRCAKAWDVSVERIPVRPEVQLREQAQAAPPEVRAGRIARRAVGGHVAQRGDPR